MSVNESPVTLRWWRLMSCMMLTSSFSTRWVPLEVPPASGLCRLQGCFFFHRVVTSPGAPAAEPSAGCLWRTPTRASTLQSVAWTCCWTVSTIRSAAEKQHPTFHHPSEYAQRVFMDDQVCPGSPPGVWVCSTDMILTVPPDFGQFQCSTPELSASGIVNVLTIECVS